MMNSSNDFRIKGCAVCRPCGLRPLRRPRCYAAAQPKEGSKKGRRGGVRLRMLRVVQMPQAPSGQMENPLSSLHLEG